MILIKFSIDEKNMTLRFNAKGHARAAKKGEDIICASASMLAYTLAQNVKNAFGLKQLKCEPVIKLEDGEAKISCQCDDEDFFNILTHTYLVIETGCLVLARNYPQYVELKMFGKSK